MEPSSMKIGSHTGSENIHPSPFDFVAYLQWACIQHGVTATISVSKVVQQEYVSGSAMSDTKFKHKSKSKQSYKETNVNINIDQEQEVKSVCPSFDFDQNNLNILAVYNANDDLVHLKFYKNKNIPRNVLQIIGLIIKYQSYLTTISINQGMDKYSIYEICKFLPVSYLTDICLDNCFLKEANYYMLLEQQNFIRHLSLARCSINDEVVESLAVLLVYPLPASNTLSILNLSSNRITDLGVKHLSEALKSNRQLSYLNLADNMISDVGADNILNTLSKFPLSFNELLSSRSRHMTYLKEKNKLVIRMAQNLRAEDFDRKSSKRKSIKPALLLKKGKMEKEASLRALTESKSITFSHEAANLEKAILIAEKTLGEFKDPFSKSNTLVENGIVYSYGNLSLSYLNLSYNNLSFTTVKKLKDVLAYQMKVERKPRGLVNVSIEGNLLPIFCRELVQVDQILGVGLSSYYRIVGTSKKRQSKITK